MTPRRLAMVPALAVVLAGSVIVWAAGFGSGGIEDTAAPIVGHAPPSRAADPEVADSSQIVLANAAFDSADTAEVAAISHAAIHQIAVSRPSVATPNARVADAFGAISLKLA